MMMIDESSNIKYLSIMNHESLHTNFSPLSKQIEAAPAKENLVAALREKMTKLVHACEAAAAESNEDDDEIIAVPDIQSVYAMRDAFECIVAANNIMLPTSVEFDCVNGCIFLVWESESMGHLDLRIDLAKSFSFSTFRWHGNIPEHQCCVKRDNMSVARTAAELAREVLADVELRANTTMRSESTH
jgi:hypothetical protein